MLLLLPQLLPKFLFLPSERLQPNLLRPLCLALLFLLLPLGDLKS
jgi:hypothetical protein